MKKTTNKCVTENDNLVPKSVFQEESVFMNRQNVCESFYVLACSGLVCGLYGEFDIHDALLKNWFWDRITTLRHSITIILHTILIVPGNNYHCSWDRTWYTSKLCFPLSALICIHSSKSQQIYNDSNCVIYILPVDWNWNWCNSIVRCQWRTRNYSSIGYSGNLLIPFLWNKPLIERSF